MGPKDPVTDLDSVEEEKPLQRRTLMVVTEEWMAPGRSLKQFPKREQIRTFGYMATRWLCVPPHCSSTVKFTHSRKGNHSRNAQAAKRNLCHRNFLLRNVHQDLSFYGDRTVLVLLGVCPLIDGRRTKD